MRKTKITKHLARQILEQIYKKEKDPRKRERLQFILALYDGEMQITAARMILRNPRTVGLWLKKWNQYGLKGLFSGHSTGRKGTLNKEEWKEIMDEIKDKGMSIKDVILYVNKKNGTSYTYQGIWNRLRRKKNGKRPARYGKPFKKHEKRPPDAEVILKKTR